jgi:CRP/FNR family cyclic AMP-dependent transcriptional regulator
MYNYSKERLMGEKSVIFENFGKVFQKGETLCKEGETGNTMYIIQQGKVKITKRIGGKEHVLAVLGKGDFFGEMALVSRIKRTASVVTLSAVELLEFDRNGFLNLIQKNTQIALNIIDKLCRRLHNANLKLKHLVPHYDKGLVCISLYYAYKEQEKESGMLDYNTIVEQISIELDLPNIRVTEIINELAKQGIVKIKGSGLVLEDEEKLRSITEMI